MLSQEILFQIIKSSNNGQTSRAIAATYNVTKSTINNFLSRSEQQPKYMKDFWAAHDEGNLSYESHLDEAIEVEVDLDIKKLSKQLRTAQKTMAFLRKQNRLVADGSNIFDQMMEGINQASQNIVVVKGAPTRIQSTINAQPATLEMLFSDLQIGKVSRYYNTAVARRAVRLYGQGIMKNIASKRNVYDVERLVFAMIGDIVEDHLKHGVDSATSTDTGLAEQMQDAIEIVWEEIIQPLAQLKIPMDIICITGNHGCSTHKGMDSFKAGRFSYDFVIHNTLKKFCQIAGYNHVTFDIPDGTFGSCEIYGKTAIYEHGYHNNFSEKGMTDQMLKRGQQIQKHVTYWRQGDKHHHTTFGQGEQVLNGAFFGIDQEGLEYSGILGFNSVPSQTIMYHVADNTLGQGNIKDIVNIQVGIID